MRRTTFDKVRVSLVRESCDVYESRARIRQPSDVVSLIGSLIGDDARECVVALYLDAQNRLAGVYFVSQGSVAQSIVHPREVFLPMFHVNAKSLILAHNHPSGDPTPSHQDRELTQRIEDAADLLGVSLLDHIIVGSTHYFSHTEDITRPLPRNPN